MGDRAALGVQFDSDVLRTDSVAACASRALAPRRSTSTTPFGLKRERWLDGALARAYGRPATEFHPWASPRTLLERVTDAVSDLSARHTVGEASIAGVSTTLALGRRVPDGPWALAYAVGGRFITTFPVESARAVLSEWNEKQSTFRWNAVAPPR